MLFYANNIQKKYHQKLLLENMTQQGSEAIVIKSEGLIASTTSSISGLFFSILVFSFPDITPITLPCSSR